MRLFELVCNGVTVTAEQPEPGNGLVLRLDRLVRAEMTPEHAEFIGMALTAWARRRLAKLATQTPMDPFFMVFREGGRSPTFKHTTQRDADIEAQRIANESGETCYVLVAVGERRPNPRPTADEIVAHVERHGSAFGGATSYGLWRVRAAVDVPPAIVAVDATGRLRQPALLVDVAGYRPDSQWWPLDANGKDLHDDDIPF